MINLYKLVACDLDETLLDHTGHVVKENIPAIQDAISRGVKFAIATGRGFQTIQGTLSELGLNDKENEFVISFNGGVISENKGNRIIEFQGLTFDEANRLFQVGVRHDVGIHVYTIDTTYVYGLSEDELNYMSSRGVTPAVLTDASLEKLTDTPIVKVLYQNLDKSYLETIKVEVEETIPYEFDISFSSNRYIEFNAKNVNKGTALLKLAAMLNIPASETIAMGDNINDYSMIEQAGIGACVANAVDEIKAISDYVSPKTYLEGGVADILTHFK